MQQLFRLDVQLVTEPELPDYADMQVMPWGWNPAIRKRMLKGGVAESLLPSAADLSRYRRLASRANVRLLYACGGEAGNMSYLCGGEGVLVTADDFCKQGAGGCAGAAVALAGLWVHLQVALVGQWEGTLLVSAGGDGKGDRLVLSRFAYRWGFLVGTYI